MAKEKNTEERYYAPSLECFSCKKDAFGCSTCPIYKKSLKNKVMKEKFEETHNLYIVEETDNNNGSRIDVERNIECLDKMLESVDKALENLKQ